MKDTFLWKKHRKKVLVLGAVLLVVVLVIILATHQKGNGFKTYVVTPTTVFEQVEIAGKVESNDFAELAFEVTGRIKSINARIGDVVERGQILARLDTGTLEADLLDAQATVDIKRSSLNNAEISLEDIIRQQDVLVANAKRALFSTDLEAVSRSQSSTLAPPVITGSYTGDAGEYKVIIESDPNNISDIVRTFGIETFEGEVEVNRARALGTKGLYIQITGDPDEYDGTVWYITIPNTRSSSYATNLNTYEQALENRTVAIRDAEALLNQNTGLSSIAEAELQQAQARVARIQAQIEQHRIRAPFTGTVSEVSGSIGEIASTGSTIISVVSGGDFEIVLDVPEIDVSKLEIGNEVDITLDAFDRENVWQGEIVAISQAENYVDGVPVYETRVRFIETDPRVRSGLSSTVRIRTETREGVLAVPLEFIDRDEDGSSFVYVVVSEEVTERRNIQTGLRGSNGFVEILSGVSEGEVVTTKPAGS